MDYTQNLHLPQWEETDRIQMDDFNDAMERIDAAIGAIPIVKLKDVTLASPAATWNIDVSGIDFTQYRKIEMQAYAPSANIVIHISLTSKNNDSIIYLERIPNGAGNRTSVSYLARMIGDTAGNPEVDALSHIRFGAPVAGMPIQCTYEYLSYRKADSFSNLSSCRWENVAAFVLTRTEGTATIPSGTKVTLYGYRK